MQYQLDSLDRRILDALQCDGRLQNLELARRVGLSPSACLRRVRLLEEGGYIDRYVALLNGQGGPWLHSVRAGVAARAG